MSLPDVEVALMTSLATTMAAIPTEFPNMHLARPSNSKWAQVFYIPNKPHVYTLGSKGRDMVTGLVQITINYPSGEGTSASHTDQAAFRAAYKAGTRLTANGQQVTLTSIGLDGSGAIEGAWFVQHISIGWYALISR